MKKNLLTSLIIISSFFCSITSAQTSNCGTDESIEKAKKSDVSYKNYLDNNSKGTGSSANIIPDNTTIYTVPIIFIVYHLGEAVGTGTNVSDANIQAALAYMNTEWRASTPQFVNGNDTKMQFAMAKRSPSCQPINGIIRVNASGVSGYASGGVPPGSAMEQTIRNLTPEYNQLQLGKYCIVRIVTGVPPYAGYAYYGGDVLFDYREMNGNANNTLLAHEMGHVFFLPHTFQGSNYNNSTNTYTCPTNSNPSTDGDGIADTDPHKQSDFDCINTSNINSCTGLAFGNIVKNFMSYATPSCIDRFTAGQIYKMRYSLINSITGLLDPLIFTTPTAAENVTASTCAITTGIAATSYYFTGISNFTFNGINNSTNSVPLYYGFYNNYSCFQKTTVTEGQTYPVQISVTTGSNRRVYIDYDDNGIFNETIELVFNNTAGANGNITISNTSVKNKYLRMRVLTSPVNSSLTACNLPSDATLGYGEIEDYGLQILNAVPTITLNIPTVIGACSGNSKNIGFTTTGTYDASNSFQVHLSDASGVFPVTPTVIGSGSSSPIGSLFPSTSTSSLNYKVKVVATNPSTSSTESTAFGILNTPVITASSTVICTGGSSILSTPTLSGASYQWIKDNVDIGGADGSSYTTTTSGIYQIRITISGCVKISNLIILNSYQNPFVSYTGSTTFCSGSTLTLTALPNNSSTTYQWRKDGVDISGATSVTYAATSSGAYSVRVTQGSCMPATTTSLTLTTVTGANSLDNSTTLYGGTDASLNYSVYYQPFNICSGSMILSTSQRLAGTTYQWQLDGVDISGETNATYTASQTGYYSVKVVQGTCSGESSPVALRIGSLTPPSLGADVSICTGATHTISNSYYQGQSCCGTDLNYQWQKDGVDISLANSPFSYSANTAGTYTLRVSKGPCISTSMPMRLVIGTGISSPTIDNGTISEVACSSSTFILSTSSNLSGLTYQWMKDGIDIPLATSRSINSTPSGKYQVRVSQGTCSATSSEIQQIRGEFGNPTISGNSRFCGSATTILSASTACGDYTYQWKRNGIAILGATLSNYTTNVPAVYTLDITKGTKTITTSSLSVYEDCSTTASILLAKPSVVSNTSDRVICMNSGKRMISVFPTSQYPTATYQWYKDGVLLQGQTSRFFFVTDAGDYQVQLIVGTFQSDLSSIYTMYDSGNNLSVSAINRTYGCTEVLLSSAIPNTTTKLPYTYQWKKDGVNIGTNQNFHDATSSGNYTLEATLGTCTITSSPIPVTIGNANATITSSLSNNRLCDNGYVTLNTNLGNTFVHQWYKDNVLIPNINARFYSVTTAGNYTFTATQGACTYSSSAAFAVTSTSSLIPSIGFIGGYSLSTNVNVSACSGSGTTLTVNPKGGIYQYQWKNAGTVIAGANTSTYQPTTSGTYNADITTLGGCVVTSPILTLDLGITPSPSFTNSSTSGSNLCSGSSTNLSVAYGNFSSYQWYKDDVLIPNATSTVYSANLAGRYNVKMIQGACTVETGYMPVSLSSTTLTPRVSNASTSNDVSCNLISGSLSTASINGGAYQWQRNGVNVIGQTNSFYNITQNGTYQVIVNQGTCTGTSNLIEIQNGVASHIYPNGPFGYICGEGALILTNFIGSGGTYQWKKDGVNIGTNGSFLPINGLGTYTVTNTINGCSATSQPFVISSISPMESSKTGLWNNPGVWTCLRTPSSLDNVKVNFGHIVSLPNTSTYFIKSINNVGSVSFGTGSNLRIGF